MKFAAWIGGHGTRQVACYGYAGVPKNWVHIVFQDYAPGSGFTAGEASATAALTLLVRTGRPPEYKSELLKRLWKLFQDATGTPDDQIVVGIQELPPEIPVGTPVAGLFGAEPVIDFEVTPNRPDWLGVAGIARDLAARRGATVVPPYDDPWVIAGQGTVGR